ncbi:MAG: glutathione S-transferase [Thermoleophilaceae bacterium]|nr:glutathione S-transferase [Thermoleophilaceae bacterium]
MAAQSTPLLWHIEVSHYNEKARWALDYKGIEHVRKAPQPGLHPVRAKTKGGSTLPILELDGKTLTDSTEIVAALERHRPNPPLYPADPDARSQALVLEDFFDEEMGPDVRRLLFFHVLKGGPDSVRAFIPPPPGLQGTVMDKMLPVIFPIMKPMLGGMYGISEDKVSVAPAKILAGFDRMEEVRAGRDYLVGDSFTIADLTAAALSHPIVRPAEFEYTYGPIPETLAPIRDELIAHPAATWVRGIYAKHRGTSAELISAAAA